MGHHKPIESTWGGAGSTTDTSKYFLGYGSDASVYNERSVYHPNIDNQKYGMAYGLMRRCLVGSSYVSVNIKFYGSRSMAGNSFTTRKEATDSARGIGSTWDDPSKYKYRLQTVQDDKTGYYCHNTPIYDSGIDGVTDYGIIQGLLRRCLVGGQWSTSGFANSPVPHWGSRSTSCMTFPSSVSVAQTAS